MVVGWLWARKDIRDEVGVGSTCFGNVLILTIYV